MSCRKISLISVISGHKVVFLWLKLLRSERFCILTISAESGACKTSTVKLQVNKTATLQQPKQNHHILKALKSEFSPQSSGEKS